LAPSEVRQSHICQAARVLRRPPLCNSLHTRIHTGTFFFYFFFRGGRRGEESTHTKPEPLSFVLCFQEEKKSHTRGIASPCSSSPSRLSSKIEHGRIRRPPEVAEHQLRSRWRQPTDPLICIFFSASSGVGAGHTQAHPHGPGGPPTGTRSRLTPSGRPRARCESL
jgi:hypothetical protein